MSKNNVATLVPDTERMNFLPSLFGIQHMLVGETRVYTRMEWLCETYSGGLWDFYTLPNGSGYMALQTDKTLKISVESNGYEGEMSADAAGIVATLFALNDLAWSIHHDGGDAERMSYQYHALREFAYDHEEAAEIFDAID